MSLIKTHHDHLTRHNEAIQPGIGPALKHLLFQMSESGQNSFTVQGKTACPVLQSLYTHAKASVQHSCLCISY